MNLKFSYKPDSQIGAGAVTYADNGASFNGGMTTIKYGTTFKVVANEGATVTTTDNGITVETLNGPTSSWLPLPTSTLRRLAA